MVLYPEDNRFIHGSWCCVLKITELLMGHSAVPTEDNRFIYGSCCYLLKITDLFMSHGAIY